MSSLVPFHSHHRDHQLPRQLELKPPFSVGWRDGSVLKSTCHSCKGPRSNSRHPHGGSQLSLTAVFINPGEGWANARLSPRIWCTEKEPGIYLAGLLMAWGQSLKGVVASHPEKSVHRTMRVYNVLDILRSPLCNTVGLASPYFILVYGSF